MFILGARATRGRCLLARDGVAHVALDLMDGDLDHPSHMVVASSSRLHFDALGLDHFFCDYMVPL